MIPEPEPSATVPRLTLRLPGTWLQLDPSLPEPTDARIRAFVRASVGRADQLASSRAGLRKALGAMLERGEGPAGLESTFLCQEIAPGVTTPIAVSVFAPADVRMSPVVGTDPEAVIGGFLDAMEVIEGAREWRRLACADGWAARRWRVVDHAANPTLSATEIAGSMPPTFAADYWRTVPATKTLVLVTVTSPLSIIPKTMLHLADAVVAGSRFASEQRARSHAME
ncbi:MAG: hypothetical protein CVT68_09045 [Actinobacteria bacterium HGW-Actinobacteria-8]|nr:MAG: hypothetical protein CVT68_09045 [Actinobacteria bacterium HGW-Actinobacteria-8]